MILMFMLVYYVIKTLQAIPNEHILSSEVNFYKYPLLSVYGAVNPAEGHRGLEYRATENKLLGLIDDKQLISSKR